MPVHVTRRRSGFWYAKGTVRVGNRSAFVAEFTTGCVAKVDAEAVAAARDAEIRQGLLTGTATRRRVTIGDCILAYLNRPGGVRSADIPILYDVNARIGDAPVEDAATAWQTWLASRNPAKPATVTRWRAVFQAMLRHGAQAHGITAPSLPTVRGGAGEERVALLNEDERRRLLAAYSPHAACPALVLAYSGMRCQEVLQLDWRRVDLERRTIRLPVGQTKSGKARAVPIHPRVDALLYGMWHSAGRPDSGPVFLSRYGEPYTDTRGRDGGVRGGNPLAKSHDTACRRAGIRGFRIHDWRHDFCGRAVMAGMDLPTLMTIGGWSSLRMLQRYASISATHAASAMDRLP